MNIIKNVHRLLDEDVNDVAKMEAAAVAHRRHAGITFKIVDYTPKKVTIQVTQEKHAAGNYHPAKRLVEIVHETFDRFFKDKKVVVNTIPFQQTPADGVDSKWINEQMLNTGTRLKQIAADTGIDYTQLSSLVSGDRPLSQPMRALFWFYFLSKQNESAE